MIVCRWNVSASRIFISVSMFINMPQVFPPPMLWPTGLFLGGETELNDYLGFLKSGGSKYPIDLLKSAGVDMLSPEPVKTALATFSALVDELEQLTQ